MQNEHFISGHIVTRFFYNRTQNDKKKSKGPKNMKNESNYKKIVFSPNDLLPGRISHKISNSIICDSAGENVVSYRESIVVVWGKIIPRNFHGKHATLIAKA